MLCVMRYLYDAIFQAIDPQAFVNLRMQSLVAALYYYLLLNCVATAKTLSFKEPSLLDK